MKTCEFDFELPEELIAQQPAAAREDSRLMVVAGGAGGVAHARFSDLPMFLRPRDVLVLNDTRVVQARIHATRRTGAKVHALLLNPVGSAPSAAMLRPLAKLKPGEPLLLDGSPVSAIFLRPLPGGLAELSPPEGMTWERVTEEFGRPPLPPYIRRPFGADPMLEKDRERYQTTFARSPGSVAAPTAGMHFTPGLLDRVRSLGVSVEFVTLTVGPGTFKPVEADEVEDHVMEGERFSVPQGTADAINAARERGGRCVAVGTTVVKSLETASLCGRLGAAEGVSDLFIRPPFEFRTVDAMVTNFHLPRSTLLMLVSAFAGRETVLRAYLEAVRERYRFFSFGDACFFNRA